MHFHILNEAYYIKKFSYPTANSDNQSVFDEVFTQSPLSNKLKTLKQLGGREYFFLDESKSADIAKLWRASSMKYKGKDEFCTTNLLFYFA